ncbi:hypothetical protein RUND412_000788 [Rhizina undulata]
MTSYTTMTSTSTSRFLNRVIKRTLEPAHSVTKRPPISYDEEELRRLSTASETGTVTVTDTATVADPSAGLPPPLSAAMIGIESQAVPVSAPANHNHGQSPNPPPPPHDTTVALPGEPVIPEPIAPTPVQEQRGGARETPPLVPPEEDDLSEGWEDVPRRPGRTGGRTRGASARARAPARGITRRNV